MPKIASQTIFDWNNQSQIASLSNSIAGAPIILIASSTDKGREDLTLINGASWFKQYVSDKKTMFNKHGQPLLQAATLIDAGAQLLFKRIVAEDAKLANVIVSLKVTKDEIVGENPQTVTLKIQVDTLASATSIDDVKVQAATMLSTTSETEKTYPLFVITDNGRGLSNKKFRIIPDYSTARELSFMRYTFQVMENTTPLENMYFALDPEVQYAGENYGMEAVIRTNSSQVKSYVYEDNIVDAVSFIATILNVDKTELMATDVLFGCSRTGQANTNIILSNDSINLNNVLGINLTSGVNGSFGDKPISTGGDSYETALTDVFTSEELQDINKYQIDAVFDANYPDTVKRSIEALADYRKDFMYFRDFGMVFTYDQIKAKAAAVTPSVFSASYHNSYDIIDPYSKKQINVTITYSLSKKFVNHFVTNKANPFEGILYGITIDDAINGTVNYLPRELKESNQKQALIDIGVNYATYYGDILTVEGQFTSDTNYTQLSWINNVIAVQEVVKMLRLHCPKTRYAFIDEDGNGNSQSFDNYKKDVQERLSDFKGNFKSLEFVYEYDDTQVQNKVFYANIYFKFRNFIESEKFNLFAINA